VPLREAHVPYIPRILTVPESSSRKQIELRQATILADIAPLWMKLMLSASHPIADYIKEAAMPERELIEGCLKGDAQAQRELYEQYKVPLFRLCLRYASSREEAEDILQEGFLKVFSDLEQYRGTGALGAWMRRVVLNVALQHLRRQKQLPVTAELETIAELADDSVEQLFSQLRAKALVGLIQQLPPGYRTVFNLYVIEGYAHREIADMLSISENTSKSQLSKAKALLRRVLEKTMAS
jgi:RNA polymerase sigma factor (sigma-70 family)